MTRRGINQRLMQTQRDPVENHTYNRELIIDGKRVCFCKGTRLDAVNCLESNITPTCPGGSNKHNDATDLILAKRDCANNLRNDPHAL